jgi:MFS family permease
MPPDQAKSLAEKLSIGTWTHDFPIWANVGKELGLSPASAGLTLLPFTLGVGLLSRFFGRLADTFGARRMLVTGAVGASAA